MKNERILKISLASMFLALAYILPFVTGNIPEIGQMLCPMHIPVILCGFICGYKYGFLVGLIAPLLRSITILLPPLFPTAISMSIELSVYGIVSGLLYKAFKKLINKEIVLIYLCLFISMISGRIIWGITNYILLLFDTGSFTFQMFLVGAFINSWPGIILQIVLIPLILITLKKIYKNEH